MNIGEKIILIFSIFPKLLGKLFTDISMYDYVFIIVLEIEILI